MRANLSHVGLSALLLAAPAQSPAQSSNQSPAQPPAAPAGTAGKPATKPEPPLEIDGADARSTDILRAVDRFYRTRENLAVTLQSTTTLDHPGGPAFTRKPLPVRAQRPNKFYLEAADLGDEPFRVAADDTALLALWPAQGRRRFVKLPPLKSLTDVRETSLSATPAAMHVELLAALFDDHPASALTADTQSIEFLRDDTINNQPVHILRATYAMNLGHLELAFAQGAQPWLLQSTFTSPGFNPAAPAPSTPPTAPTTPPNTPVANPAAPAAEAPVTAPNRTMNVREVTRLTDWSDAPLPKAMFTIAIPTDADQVEDLLSALLNMPAAPNTPTAPVTPTTPSAQPPR
jgi:hypothetical protein